jgi:hypothetical protein
MLFIPFAINFFRLEVLESPKSNTVHLSDLGNWWAVTTQRFVILNGAQHSEESLFYQ